MIVPKRRGSSPFFFYTFHTLKTHNPATQHPENPALVDLKKLSKTFPRRKNDFASTLQIWLNHNKVAGGVDDFQKT